MNMVISNIIKMILSSKYFYIVMTVFVFISTMIMIFSSGYRGTDQHSICDYKSISNIRIEFGGNINYRIHIGNRPVIVRRLRSYDGDILVLYIKMDSVPEIKRGDN